MDCEKRMTISVLGALSFTLWLANPALRQSNSELRLKATDPTGLGVRCSVKLASEANQYHQDFLTDDSGALAVNHFPFGIYHVSVEHPGFAPFSGSVEIRSAIPAEYEIKLVVAQLNTAVVVKEEETLVDPHRT